MDAIVIESLKKSFGAFNALRTIDLRVPEGQFVTLLGPSGSGKTTTLRCLAGLEDPTGGFITLGGKLVAAPGRGVSIPPERRSVGFVFQNYALWPHMTVRGNVEYPLRLKKASSRERRKRVDHLLDLVGLADFASKRASDLSGGQQQRVALARALANDSPFMLYDEPLSNLDAALRVKTRDAIRDIHDRLGTTTVYVTHDQDEAFSISDRVVIMNHGVIEQDGTPEEIYARPGSEFIARFVGFRNLLSGAKVLSLEGSEQAVVDVPGVGQCTAHRGGFNVGDIVTVAFRARDLFLDDGVHAAGEAGPYVPGTVQTVAFSSGDWTVAVQVGSTTIGVKSTNDEGRPAVAPGDLVSVGIKPGRGVLLRPDSAVPTKE